jgi:hypothetical protein
MNMSEVADDARSTILYGIARIALRACRTWGSCPAAQALSSTASALTSWTSRASVTGLAVLGHLEVENLTTIVTEHEVHVKFRNDGDESGQ